MVPVVTIESCSGIDSPSERTGGPLIPLFASSTNGAIWVVLLEKALAKHYGSYANLHARSAGDVLADLSGEVAVDYIFPFSNTALDYLHDPSVGYLDDVYAEGNRPADKYVGVDAETARSMTDLQYIKGMRS